MVDYRPTVVGDGGNRSLPPNSGRRLSKSPITSRLWVVTEQKQPQSTVSPVPIERASRSGGGRRRRSSRRSPRRRRGATGGSHRGRVPRPLRGDRDRVEEKEKGSSRLASPRCPGRDRLFVALLLSNGLGSGSPRSIRTSHTCTIRELRKKAEDSERKSWEKLVGEERSDGRRLFRLHRPEAAQSQWPARKQGIRRRNLYPNKRRLDWNTRMRIAAGAAKGLEYLHDTARPPVIYRDLKCSNILLDEGYHPKLSDFGLAKLGPVGDDTHVSTRVMGTYGYCAPEYAMTGQLTVKSDVYSFGVVLLELITGRRAVDNSRGAEEHNLVAWVRKDPVL
ncbi:hypothetical protein GW17_00052203 [Ensete ventricosum]|nr:hypothetical protein GW17_00052203 [Ensete ventricosum]